MKKVVIALAIFGYTLGYSYVYAFHIAVVAWLLSVPNQSFNKKSINVTRKRDILFPFGIFVGYTLLTGLWHPDLIMWLQYHLYLMCGLAAIMAVYQSINSKQQLNSIFKLISIIVCLNLLFGFMESLGIGRLPMSPYSPYIEYFGRSGIDLSKTPEDAWLLESRYPTGFNGNPNNFGFVVLLSLPFILFLKKRSIQIAGIILIAWLLIAGGSKAHFLAFLFALSLLPFYHYRFKERLFFAVSGPLVIAAILFTPYLVSIENPGLNRMYGTYEQVLEGLDMMMTGDMNVSDSTSQRAKVYSIGLDEFASNYGRGLGFGGIETKLDQIGRTTTSFHFFFFQMLIDLGLPMFIIFMFYYMRKTFLLWKITMQSKDKELVYFAQATSMSMLLAIPASLGPSSVIYLLTYYVLIGFALSVLKVYKEERNQKKPTWMGRQLYTPYAVGER